ncbi:hypothetical protein ACFX13_001663 [Malus domestica]
MSSKPRHCYLATILKKDGRESRWDGDRLVDTYRNIIRFILEDLFKQEDKCGNLEPENILITSEEAKVERLGTKARQSLRKEFISLIEKMLSDEDNSKRLELKHFIKMADNPSVTFEMLYHHPLLQSPGKRCYFPIQVVLHLNDERIKWRKEYRRSNREEVNFGIIETSIYKDGLQSVFRYQRYENTVVGVLDFSKNVANHINQHLKRLRKNRMKQNEIEEELTRLFPTRLIDLYEYLVSKRISMAFLKQ